MRAHAILAGNKVPSHVREASRLFALPGIIEREPARSPAAEVRKASIIEFWPGVMPQTTTRAEMFNQSDGA